MGTREKVVHNCPTCGFPMDLRWPSNMLACMNPICTQDPLWVIRERPVV